MVPDLIFLVRTQRGPLLSPCARKDRFLILTSEDPSLVPEVPEHPVEDPGPGPVIGRAVWSARRYNR